MLSVHPISFLIITVISTIGSYGIFYFGDTLFRKLGLLDNPGPYGHLRNPVPFGFGLLLYFNFVTIASILVIFGLIELNDKLLILILLGGLVSGFSFIDDLDTIFKFDRSEKSKPKITTEDLAQTRKTKFALSPKFRLGMQILVGLIISLTSIKISYISNIFGGILYLDFFSIYILGYEVFLIPIFFTIFWYVLVFNSVNWSDGIPGLTIGLTTITLLVILISTIRFYLVDDTPELRQNALFVFSILAIIIPSLLWAWYYNITPKMLLGDSGTMFLAFIIASLAILVGGKIATVATALGVYLVDAIYVIFARIFNKKNPLKGDRIHHLHYRLKAIGMSDVFIRNFVYSMALFFGISAVFLDKIGKIILFTALVLVIVFITKILSLSSKNSSKSGFSLVELLIVMSIISIVSVTGFKIFSSLETSSKNLFVESRLSSFINTLDRQISDGIISDYSMEFLKNKSGVIVTTNTYRAGDPVKIDYDWTTGTGVLIFSGATKPGFALVSENRTYEREVHTTPDTILNFALTGSFDLPQQIITVDNGVQKNIFLIFPLDNSILGEKVRTNIGFFESMTGITLKNIRSQKTLYDTTGLSHTGVVLKLTRGDYEFGFTLNVGK